MKMTNTVMKPAWAGATLRLDPTRFPQQVTAFAAGSESLQRDYGGYGHKLTKHFDPSRP